jgi:hypothetical protein
MAGADEVERLPEYCVYVGDAFLGARELPLGVRQLAGDPVLLGL